MVTVINRDLATYVSWEAAHARNEPQATQGFSLIGGDPPTRHDDEIHVVAVRKHKRGGLGLGCWGSP